MRPLSPEEHSFASAALRRRMRLNAFFAGAFFLFGLFMLWSESSRARVSDWLFFLAWFGFLSWVYWSHFSAFRQLNSELRTGMVEEERGAVERKGGRRGSQFPWIQVGGEKYQTFEDFYRKARKGQHVLICYLPGSRLVVDFREVCEQGEAVRPA